MESKILIKGLQNSLFVVSSQVIKFALGISRALILPIILGVTNFGYWQIYLLYVGYVGLFSLGFNDGIYLKYGKYDYKDLPKYKFRTSIRMFIIIQIITTFLVSMLIMFEPDQSKQTVILLAALNIPILGLSGVLTYVLQITNQLKKYSLYTILDQCISLVIILIALFTNSNDYILIILADIVAKLVVLAFMLYSCKEILFGKGSDLKSAFNELIENINVGIKLMFANFAGMLVLGFGRVIIERFKSVEIYGIYSFSITTLNLVLIFVIALGTVIYPTLSRIEYKRYPILFTDLNKIIQITTFILLISYFPLGLFILSFMEGYNSIFEYLPIIFAIGYVQSKFQLLINPFYKLLREEKAMLSANVIGLMMAVVLVSYSFWITKSVLMVAVSTLVAMSLRLTLSEKYLKKVLAINQASSYSEVFFIFIFIYFAYLDNLIIGAAGYCSLLIMYIFYHRKFIKRLTRYFNKKE